MSRDDLDLDREAQETGTDIRTGRPEPRCTAPHCGCESPCRQFDPQHLERQNEPDNI